MAFALADEIETRADKLRARRPDLSRVASINQTLAEMAGE